LDHEPYVGDPYTKCNSRNNLIFVPDRDAGGFPKRRLRDDNRDVDS
jgi:hypothetical protein